MSKRSYIHSTVIKCTTLWSSVQGSVKDFAAQCRIVKHGMQPGSEYVQEKLEDSGHVGYGFVLQAYILMWELQPYVDIDLVKAAKNDSS